MLSLVKVEHAVPCEGDDCPNHNRGRTANNHVFLFGHSYLRLCLDCVLQHAALWADNGGIDRAEELRAAHFETTERAAA